jgi:crossover junction endodeoxyribonuclease RuvC
MHQPNQPKQIVTILGIDPGTRVSGYSIIHTSPSSNSTLIDLGVLKPKANLLLSEKYHYLFEMVKSLITHYKVDQVAVESQFLNKNFQSAAKVSMAKGAVLIAATALSIPVFEYSPNKVKEAVTGHGLSTKEQVAQMLQKLFPILNASTSPLDATDALAIALCHHNQLAYIQHTPSSHRI